MRNFIYLNIFLYNLWTKNHSWQYICIIVNINYHSRVSSLPAHWARRPWILYLLFKLWCICCLDNKPTHANKGVLLLPKRSLTLDFYIISHFVTLFGITLRSDHSGATGYIRVVVLYVLNLSWWFICCHPEKAAETAIMSSCGIQTLS